MSARGWSTLKQTFASLCDLPDDERTIRLARLRSHDPALADRLTALLSADDVVDCTLEPFELLRGADADAGDVHADPLGLVGTTVNQFRIQEVLGAGGMGVAYRAQDTRLGRAVALKFLLPEYARDAIAKQRLLHEARTASTLDHPNVCTLLEICDSPHGPFLAMPAYPGETLQQQLARKGRIDPDEAVAIFRQVLRGLAAAHEAGITHRDLKPGNLLRTPDGTVKILDFGLARAGDVTRTRPHMRAGTVAYMSPEQLRGAAIDARSDLWSAGVVLYELLTGVRPFGSGADLSTIYLILHEEPASPSSRAPGIPAWLDDVVLRLLRRDPAQRFADAAAVLTALDAEAPSVAAPPIRASRWQRLKRSKVAAAALGLLVFTAAAAGPVLLRGPATALTPSIAVMPFVDTSPARDQQHLAEGIAEEVLNALIGVPGLRVSARPTTVQMRGAGATPRDVARLLDVGSVLEGSVHRDGEHVRVTARLLDTGSGRYHWSRTFERRFADIFQLQGEIASTVARALEVAAAPGPPHGATSNVVAYELYLRGLFHWNRRTPVDLRRAIDFFQQSTQHDPTYARSWTGLALAYVVLAVMDPAATELLGRAHSAADRALAIDAQLADAYAARAYAFHWQWRWAEATQSFERALALQPDNATVHQWFGEHLSLIGRFGDGERHMRRAIELDPLSIVSRNDLGLVYLMQSRLDEAIAQFAETARIDPGFPLPHLLLHRTYLAAGEFEAAAESGRRWAELTGAARADELMLLARAVGDAAMREDARRVLDRWQAQPVARWMDIAMYRTLVGDADIALDMLEIAHRERVPMFTSIIHAPWFDPLRDKPRFVALVTQIRP